MTDLHAGMHHDELCHLAALEYKVTCQLGQGNGQTGNGERWVSSEHNPSRLRSSDGESFVGVELGFGPAQGPSLQMTLRTLEEDNRKREIMRRTRTGDDEVLAIQRRVCARRAKKARA